MLIKVLWVELILPAFCELDYNLPAYSTEYRIGYTCAFSMFLLDEATMFNLSVLDQKKIQNLMRESGKKHLRKKAIQSIFEKNKEGD